MFHAGGLSHAIRSLAFAMVQTIIPNPRDTQHIIKEMARYRPTYISCVPTLYLRFMQEPEFRGLDLSCLRICACGAAPFPAEKFNDFEEVFGPGKMINSLGVTEATNILISNPRKGTRKIGSVGVPIPSTRVRLVDIETGEREVPFGEEGEIIARGPQIMKGYLNKPEETAIALREHNGELWLHTGDVARMDEDGFFFIVDRIKDMISVGGFKVFSSEVEHKLSKSPAVGLCAIIGVPNPERPGDSIVKLVIQKSPAYRDVPDEVLQEQLIAFCREQMAPYKVPKIIEFMESMPLTSVGKVDKKSLRRAGQSK
jgi:acyl-CoA synthetase (AMP-forming)/AMP-acid ligase II